LIINKDIIEPFKAVYSSNAEYVYKSIYDEKDYKPGIYDIKLGSQAVNGKTYGNYKTNKDLIRYIACEHKTDCYCNTIVNYVIKEQKTCVCLFPLPDSQIDFVNWVNRFNKLYKNDCSVVVLSVTQLHTPEVFLIVTNRAGDRNLFIKSLLKQYARAYIADMFVRMPNFYTGLYPTKIKDKQFSNFRRDTLNDKLIMRYVKYGMDINLLNQTIKIPLHKLTLDGNKDFSYQSFKRVCVINRLTILDEVHPFVKFCEKLMNTEIKFVPWHLFDKLFEQFNLATDYKKILTLFLSDKYEMTHEGMFKKKQKDHIELKKPERIRKFVTGGKIHIHEDSTNKMDFEDGQLFLTRQIEERIDNDYF